MVLAVIIACSLLAQGIEGIGRDVVEIDEGHARLFHHLTVPLAEGIVATL